MNEIKSSYDVVIIGGAIIGSSVAYSLAQDKGFNGSILVVERQPNYFECSTALSVGGFRQQFSTSENIEMSKFGVKFFKDVDKYLTVDGYNPDISIIEKGYLFLATQDGVSILNENYKLQKKHGVDVSLFNKDELHERFKWLNTIDLEGGCIGNTNEGWIDPMSLLKRFKNKAIELGVCYLKDEVIDINITNNKAQNIVTEEGFKINCGVIVNAAGPRAENVAKMAGINNFPVRSRKRFVYTFRCNGSIENCPMVIDPTGVYFRPDGRNFICGVSPPENNDPDTFDFDIDNTLFEEYIWPILANRVPIFDAIRREHTWAGQYAYNIFDQNAILGPHTEIKNFIFANGFSGHGLQRSPAVGRAISELIIYKKYKTLDLSRFGYSRFIENRLIKEKNVV